MFVKTFSACRLVFKEDPAWHKFELVLIFLLTIFCSAAVHIWAFMDRIISFPQTTLGALCEPRIISQYETLLTMSWSIVFGSSPGNLHGLRPIYLNHSPRTSQNAGESYHSISKSADLLQQCMRYHLNKAASSALTFGGRGMNQKTYSLFLSFNYKIWMIGH